MAARARRFRTALRDHYGVPARLNGRIRYTWRDGNHLGTIVGRSGPHLLIQFDGETEPMPCHPTWEIEYLTDEAAIR